MREQPEQQAPPVMRMRIRYAKRGRLRFTSHRDFSRAFERALVRARVPMAYSSGFHPHPRISYSNASPTGAATEAEYLEIGLSQACEPERIRALLDESLPTGLDIVEVVVSGPTGGFSDRLQVSQWRIEMPGVEEHRARSALGSFLATKEIKVERMTKRGLRTFDVRDAVLRAAVADTASTDPPCAILHVVLRHGTPSVRPDDVLAGLSVVADLTVDSALFERLAQGPWLPESGTVGDPLAPDRDAV